MYIETELFNLSSVHFWTCLFWKLVDAILNIFRNVSDQVS